MNMHNDCKKQSSIRTPDMSSQSRLSRLQFSRKRRSICAQRSVHVKVPLRRTNLGLLYTKKLNFTIAVWLHISPLRFAKFFLHRELLRSHLLFKGDDLEENDWVCRISSTVIVCQVFSLISGKERY
jgi:hypothetical protein